MEREKWRWFRLDVFQKAGKSSTFSTRSGMPSGGRSFWERRGLMPLRSTGSTYEASAGLGGAEIWLRHNSPAHGSAERGRRGKISPDGGNLRLDSTGQRGSGLRERPPPIRDGILVYEDSWHLREKGGRDEVLLVVRTHDGRDECFSVGCVGGIPRSLDPRRIKDRRRRNARRANGL